MYLLFFRGIFLSTTFMKGVSKLWYAVSTLECSVITSSCSDFSSCKNFSWSKFLKLLYVTLSIGKLIESREILKIYWRKNLLRNIFMKDVQLDQSQVGLFVFIACILGWFSSINVFGFPIFLATFMKKSLKISDTFLGSFTMSLF
jgi:hypothetical protein